MTGSGFLEAFMLICFSAGWYWSIARMIRVRAAVGKSACFVVLVCAGYLSGILAKAMLWWETGDLSPLILLYAWNLCVTAFDLALVLYFTRAARHEGIRPQPVREASQTRLPIGSDERELANGARQRALAS